MYRSEHASDKRINPRSDFRWRMNADTTLQLLAQIQGEVLFWWRETRHHAYRYLCRHYD